ncbi:NADP-dependent oxidoreductase [Spirillospora sp. NPDC046719]
MRAVAMTSFGGPEVLSVVEIPTPEPEAGQVRVRVAAATVNNFDLVARAGWLGGMLPAGPRYVLGWDVAGEIDAVAPDVTGLAPGDAVIGMSDWLDTKAGTYAEYVVLNAASVTRAPAGATPLQAATIPVNGLTALRILELLDPAPGATIAVTGAGGAVGGYTAELAAGRGHRVLAVASAQDEAFLTGLGAVFVPRSDDPVAALRAHAPDGVDALVDAATIGPEMIAAVRDGGAYAGLTPPKTPEPERGISVHRVHVTADGARLAELVSLAEQGRFTLRVAQDFPFEQAPQAHAMLAKGGVRGRVLLTP